MKTISWVALVIALAGCGGMPSNPNEQGSWYANFAKTEFAKGNNDNAAEKLEHASSLPGGVEHVRKLMAENPSIRTSYLANMRQKMESKGFPSELAAFRSRVNFAASSGMLSPEDSAALKAALSKHIERSNETGAVPFLIDGDFKEFPELADGRQAALAFERTLTTYQEVKGPRDLGPLIKFATRVGWPSPQTKRIADALPNMNIRAAELAQLEPFFPEFVSQRRSQVSTKVFLAVKNADRLFADDLKGELQRSVRGVTWLAVPEPGAIHLTIEKVRSDEQAIPEKTETVTYSTADINFLSAALLMPKNASYLFDLVTGGYSLDYGYVVTARRDQSPPTESVVRGKVEANYRKCLNPRIQNVFGGVSRADFVANENMQQRCSGPSSASMDELRQQVLAKIADQVINVPGIHAVHSMN